MHGSSYTQGDRGIARSASVAYVCSMFGVKFNLRDLAKTKGIKTPYSLAKATRFDIPISTAARLMNEEKPPTRIDFRTLDILCTVLDIGVAELLEPQKPKRRPS
jgi:DNA-binding Xre family transcriptional regulator